MEMNWMPQKHFTMGVSVEDTLTLGCVNVWDAYLAKTHLINHLFFLRLKNGIFQS
jgi:hypothetical protein